VVSSLAYPNLLGTKRLGCCCCIWHFCMITYKVSLYEENNTDKITKHILRSFVLKKTF
jgi:hypothetical protein